MIKAEWTNADALDLQATCNKLATDTISRQAAIDEIDEWIKAFLENGHKESAADACLIQDGIIQLPSAQPEQLSLQKFTEYQIEWLTSHCDIELEPVLEGFIVRFLRDTAECYEAERREE